MFQSIRTYRRTGDDFSATVLCTYVRSILPQIPLYRKNADRQSLYFLGGKSRQVKSANDLTDGRNGFTKSRFSEQESRCTEAFENTRFETKSRGIGKTVGATCGQDITPAILNGFYHSRVFYQTAKRMRRKTYLLRCFTI